MAKTTVKKVETKVESKIDKRTIDAFPEQVAYIIALMVRAQKAGKTHIGHYSSLCKYSIDTLTKMGVQYKETGKHGYLFTIPAKTSGTWRKMMAFGKPAPERDAKGHFVKK